MLCQTCLALYGKTDFILFYFHHTYYTRILPPHLCCVNQHYYSNIVVQMKAKTKTKKLM